MIEVFFEVVQRREKKCAREARAGVTFFFSPRMIKKIFEIILGEKKIYLWKDLKRN